MPKASDSNSSQEVNQNDHATFSAAVKGCLRSMKQQHGGGRRKEHTYMRRVLKQLRTWLMAIHRCLPQCGSVPAAEMPHRDSEVQVAQIGDANSRTGLLPAIRRWKNEPNGVQVRTIGSPNEMVFLRLCGKKEDPREYFCSKSPQYERNCSNRRSVFYPAKPCKVPPMTQLLAPPCQIDGHSE